MRCTHLGGIVVVLLVTLTGPGHAQNAASGAQIFRAQCSICHSPQPGRNVVGPSLFGVVGRHSGIIPDFHYSTANRASGLVWDPPTLDRYLTAPREVVPGTLMSYPGLKDDHKRSDLIAYLSSLR
jgi:cytochrome c